MRTSTLNDPSIGERAKQIADERLKTLTQCCCRQSNDGGQMVTTGCPIHSATPIAKPDGGMLTAPVDWNSPDCGCCGFVALNEVEHFSDDDWETLRKQINDSSRESWKTATLRRQVTDPVGAARDAWGRSLPPQRLAEIISEYRSIYPSRRRESE